MENLRKLSRRLSVGLACASLVFLIETMLFLPSWIKLGLDGLVSTVVALASVYMLIALGLGDRRRLWSATLILLPSLLVTTELSQGAFGSRIGLLIGVGALIASTAIGARFGLACEPLVAATVGGMIGAILIRFQVEHYLGVRTPLIAIVVVAIGAAVLILAAIVWGRRVSGTRIPSTVVALSIAFASLAAVSVVANVNRGADFRVHADWANRSLPSSGPIVLIVLDTVRADHLRQYGYERDTMPFLEEFFRREGASAHRAVAASPSSLPTHASMFTGLDPPRHGAHKPLIDDDAPPPYAYPLRHDVPTLAGLLAEAGYISVGISGNAGPLASEFGLDRGFDYYRAHPQPECNFREFSAWTLVVEQVDWIGTQAGFERPDCRVPYRRAGSIVTESIDVIDELEAEGERPFFLFVNLIDAHFPYDPPEAFAEKYLEALRVDSPQTLPSGASSTSPGRQRAVALYDGELAYVDAQLQRLLARLREHPRWNETALIVTADHGEAFGEHGYSGHSVTLYDEMIRVPFFMKPGRERILTTLRTRLTQRTVRSVDVFPTLLRHAGIVPPDGIDGVDLGRSASSVVKSWAFLHLHAIASNPDVARELRSVEESGWKLIEANPGSVELYDLREDPSELNDLAHIETARTELMRAFLEPRQPYRLFVKEKTPQSAETLRQLRALGYIH